MSGAYPHLERFARDADAVARLADEVATGWMLLGLWVTVWAAAAVSINVRFGDIPDAVD